MKKYLMTIVCLLIAAMSFGQSKNDIQEVKSTLSQNIDKCAMYPGGIDGVNAYIHKNIYYPISAMKNGKEGIVTVQFTVKEDGSVANVKVVKGLDQTLDAEAIKIVSKMKGWTPANKGGKAVAMDYQVNCKFSKE